MTAIALKQYLVSHINEIDDTFVLNRLKAIVDYNPAIFSLSDVQHDNLLLSRKQFAEGDVFSEGDVDKIVLGWKNEQ